MAFWDVGSTNKLVGAPISGDQSALTEMQDWLDKEAKRKRDEEAARRAQALLDKIGEGERDALDTAANAANQNRIQQNLGFFRQATPEGDASAIEQEIRANPTGVYDPYTKTFYKGGESERDFARRNYGLREADKKYGKSVEDAKLMVSQKAAAERQLAIEQMSDLGLDEFTIGKVLDRGDAAQAHQILSELSLKKDATGSADSQYRKVADQVEKAINTARKVGADGGTALAKQMYAQKGAFAADAQRALEEQLSTERGSEYGQLETAAAERDALLKGYGQLAQLAASSPTYKVGESATMQAIKAIDDRRLKLDLQRDKREQAQDAGRFSVLNNASTQYTALSKQILDLEKVKKAAEDRLRLEGVKGRNRAALQAGINLTNLKIARMRQQLGEFQATTRFAGDLYNNIGLIAANKGESSIAQFLENELAKPQFDSKKFATALEEFAGKDVLPGTARIDIYDEDYEVPEKESLWDRSKRAASNLGKDDKDKAGPPKKKAKRSAAKVTRDGTGGGAGPSGTSKAESIANALANVAKLQAERDLKAKSGGR